MKNKKDPYSKRFAATTVELGQEEKEIERRKSQAVDESSLPGYMRGINQRA